jgi:hypothetical protein
MQQRWQKPFASTVVHQRSDEVLIGCSTQLEAWERNSVNGMSNAFFLL